MEPESIGTITPETKRLRQELTLNPKTRELTESYTNSSKEKCEVRIEEINLDKNKKTELLKQTKVFIPEGYKKLNANIVNVDATLSRIQKIYEKLDLDNVSNINTNYSFFRLFQSSSGSFNIDDDNLSVESQLPIIPYYGISSKATKGLVGSFLTKDILHPIEKEVLEKATDYLIKFTLDAETHLKLAVDSVLPNNVILVNFFPRKTDVIHLDPNDLESVETHTIVLWKTKENEITIIDPSNSDFSEFFFNINVSHNLIFKKAEDFFGRKDKDIIKQIYQGSRDCTDIAVKIGFELNEKQSFFDQNSRNSVKDCLIESIKCISNYLIIPPIKDLKTLQSSDLKLREATKELLDNKKYKLLMASKKDKGDHIMGLDLNKLKTQDDIQKFEELLGELSEEGII